MSGSTEEQTPHGKVRAAAATFASHLAAAKQGLSQAEVKELEKAVLAELGQPDQSTTNRVWLLIVRGFVTVMIVSALILCISVFVKAEGATEPTIILTVFSSVTAFLAGLLSPSPVRQKDNG